MGYKVPSEAEKPFLQITIHEFKSAFSFLMSLTGQDPEIIMHVTN